MDAEKDDQALLTEKILHNFIQKIFLIPQDIDSESTDKGFLEKVFVLEKISNTIKTKPKFNEILSKYFFCLEESSIMFVVKDIMEDLPSNWGRIVTVLTLYVELKKQAFFTRNKQVNDADIRQMTKIMRLEVFDNFVQMNGNSWNDFMELFGEKKISLYKNVYRLYQIFFTYVHIFLFSYELNELIGKKPNTFLV